jgi:serine/threonine protein kinase
LKTEEIIAPAISAPRQSGTENCLPIGTRLVDFEITGILGEGGFGIVYVAFDHSLQRTVAIKEYMPGTLAGRAQDDSVSVRADRHQDAFNAGLKSFINEARLLAQFDHPSLVKVYRFWEQNKTAYMAMRYYDGQTLKDIVRDRPEIVTEAWLKFIFKQILEALDALYKAKILHRDVSPDNIIVQKNGDAVLLDFGSARQIIGDMTQGLTVILKPGYAPVEQYSDDASMTQGPWTDIYALAAVMYFAIAKVAPSTSVARMIKDSLAPLQDGAHIGFSYKFLVAIDKGLALQPQDRPQTMDEFRRLLGIAAFVSGRSSRSSRSSSKQAASENAKEVGDAAAAMSTTGQKTTLRTRKAKEVVNDEKTVRLTKAAKIKPAMFGLVVVAVIVGVAALLLRGNKPDSGAATRGSASAVITAVPRLPVAASLPLADQETSDWRVIRDNPKPERESIITFMQKYPAGKYLELAKVRLADLKPASAVAIASAASVSLASVQVSAASTATAAVPVAHVAADAVKQPVPEEPPVMSVTMRLVIKPWGAVFVDGKQMGVSPPLKKLTLTEGKHKIKIVNEAFPNYLTEIEVTKASKKKLGIIEYDFTATQK